MANLLFTKKPHRYDWWYNRFTYSTDTRTLHRTIARYCKGMFLSKHLKLLNRNKNFIFFPSFSNSNRDQMNHPVMSIISKSNHTQHFWMHWKQRCGRRHTVSYCDSLSWKACRHCWIFCVCSTFVWRTAQCTAAWSDAWKRWWTTRWVFFFSFEMMEF